MLSIIGSTLLGQALPVFRLVQAHVELPQIVVYAEVLDREGNPVTNLPANQYSATVGALPASISAVQSFDESGEGIGYVFLVDVSLSLSPQRFSELRAALKASIAALGPNDRAVILTFGNDVRAVVGEFSANRDELARAVESLQRTDANTRLHEALLRGMEFAQVRDTTVPRRRVIILLSDGQDDFPGGVTRDELIERMQEQYLPVYAIGYLVPPRTSSKTSALDALAEFARRSRGAYLEAGSLALDELFATLRQQIRGVNVIRLRCAECVADGNLHRLQINVATARGALSDGLDLRFFPPTASAGGMSPWLIGILVVLVGVGAFLVMREIGKRRPAPEPPPSPAPPPQPTKPLIRSATPKPPGLPIVFDVIGRSPRSGQTHRLELAARIIIGRDRGSNLAFPDDHLMSARHCEITRDQEAVIIRDLVTPNGTIVNGVPIRPVHRLEDGDVILVGETEMRVRLIGV